MKVKGVLEIKTGGFGFIRREEGDIFVPSSMKRGAVHGQTVVAEVDSVTGRGRVINVLSPYPEIVGTVQRNHHTVFLVPDLKQYDDIFIPKGKDRGACSGDKAVVVIEKPATEYSSAEGKITEILGGNNDAGIDMISVARSCGIKPGFMKETEKYARGLKFFPDNVTRQDFRAKKVFTIDGDDAKDLDDAVSIEKLENGNYLLGVHIADVSHYVREADPVDTEALKRGTSVYFPGFVIPMLPKTLSNDLCSLNAGEEKLTLSCVMEISPEGETVSSDIFKSRIKSCARLTYSGVNSLYDGRDEKGYSFLKPELDLLSELAEILKGIRTHRGSINFDFDEPEFVLDEKGWPENIIVSPRGKAEQVIEECMLAANMTVAKTFRQMEMPFVYRIHEKPDGSDIHQLAVFLSGLGIHLKGNQNIHPGAIQKVLDDAKGMPEEGVVSRMTLRSMKKARYSVLPEGHFGLSAEDYCHFTSPIRRYPDLMVHRIISAFLEGQMEEGLIGHLDSILPGIAEKTSQCEKRAVEAERKVRDIKMAQYMKNKIGQVFSGIVSGVTSFGIFVELENTVEGMVPLDTLPDEYELNREKCSLIGEYTKEVIRIGDRMSVQCVRVNVHDGRIDFDRIQDIIKGNGKSKNNSDKQKSQA